MALTQAPDHAGLWVDPALAGQPATHAVVIGVSAYLHLRDGSGPPSLRQVGLGQLAVSALTGFRFFCWLRDAYRFDGAPIGSIRLHLAPTDGELAAEPALANTYAAADFDTCQRSLVAWRQQLAALPDPVASASRSVFFFSGHGLEISQQKQILLPSDYLDPDLDQLNRAISTLNLKLGMLPLKVPDQFFLVDACRNGSQQFGGAEVEGTDIFNVLAPDQNNDLVNSVVLYGTASGSQSWQPATPSEGPSLFGEALLAAVTGGARIDSAEEPPTVWFTDVASFTNQQIANLLRQRGAQVRQAVRGDLGFVGMVHADAAPGEPPAPPAPSPTETGGVAAGEAMIPAGAVGDTDFEDLAPGRFEPPASGWVSIPRDADPHEWFGRETITATWMEHTRATDLRTGTPVELQTLGVDRFDVQNHRVRFTVDSAAPTWVTIHAPSGQYACVLPGFRDAVYELSMTWNDSDLVQVDVDLSTDSDPPLDTSAALWSRYRSEDAATASRDIAPRDLEKAVGAVLEKVATPPSPLSAVVSSLVLLHAGVRDPVLPEPWARNMAHLPQFADLADGVVIWAELLARMRSKAPRSPAGALAELAGRLLPPVTGDAVGFATALTEMLLATLPPRDPNREAILHVDSWLRGIQRHIEPGGLFLVLAGDHDTLERGLVLAPLLANEG